MDMRKSHDLFFRVHWIIAISTIAVLIGFMLLTLPSAARAPALAAPALVASKASSSSLGFDLDRLARAVAAHETCGCTCGVAVSLSLSGRVKNNCFGMHNQGGQIIDGTIAKIYASRADSFADFEAYWIRRFGTLPNATIARIYTGHDGTA